MSDHETKVALELEEDADVELVRRVIEGGYAVDLDDEEIEIIGRDPFLIAYGLRDRRGRCVVTAEVSRPGRVRAKRHTPDVCDHHGVQWIDGFGLIRSSNFSTSWRAHL